MREYETREYERLAECEGIADASYHMMEIVRGSPNAEAGASARKLLFYERVVLR